MYRLRSGLQGDPHHSLDVQVAGHGIRRIGQQHRLVGKIRVHRMAFGSRMDGYRLDAKTPAGRDNPAGDLASVGYEDFGEHCPVFASSA